MSNNAVEIGNRIREARKAKGINQQQLGNLIGKSLRSVQMYEKGESDLSIAQIYTIARALGTTPTELIGYERKESTLNSLSDVMGVLFDLFDIADLNYSIDVKRPPHSEEWECSLVFKGKDNSAKYNQDFCLFLENYRDELYDFATYRHGKKSFEEWKQETLTYYSDCELSKKEYEELSDDELRAKRNKYLEDHPFE